MNHLVLQQVFKYITSLPVNKTLLYNIMLVNQQWYQSIEPFLLCYKFDYIIEHIPPYHKNQFIESMLRSSNPEFVLYVINQIKDIPDINYNMCLESDSMEVLNIGIKHNPHSINWNYCLSSNNINIVRLGIAKDALYRVSCLSSSNMEIVQLGIDFHVMNKYFWDECLLSSNINVVNLGIENGANEWDLCLSSANMEVVLLGINRMNNRLKQKCCNDYLINWNRCLRSSNIDVVRLGLKQGASKIINCFISKNINVALLAICIMKHIQSCALTKHYKVQPLLLNYNNLTILPWGVLQQIFHYVPLLHPLLFVCKQWYRYVKPLLNHYYKFDYILRYIPDYHKLQFTSRMLNLSDLNFVKYVLNVCKNDNLDYKWCLRSSNIEVAKLGIELLENVDFSDCANNYNNTLSWCLRSPNMEVAQLVINNSVKLMWINGLYSLNMEIVQLSLKNINKPVIEDYQLLSSNNIDVVRLYNNPNYTPAYINCLKSSEMEIVQYGINKIKNASEIINWDCCLESPNLEVVRLGLLNGAVCISNCLESTNIDVALLGLQIIHQIQIYINK